MSNDTKHEKAFSFFVDNAKYESTDSTLTGAQIKAMVPNFDPTYSLYLEGPGNDPDLLIQDNTSVNLEKDKGPQRFYSVPPANFGCA